MHNGPTLDRELSLRRQGYQVVAGVDEVGRGAWAGPVVACAAVLPLNCLSSAHGVAGIRDSKRLTPKRRDEYDDRIRETALALGIGVAGAGRVDEMGIVATTKLAMSRALDQLCLPPDYLLVDGFPLAYRGLPHQGIAGGDDLSASIAAASIVAKVARDEMMVSLDDMYPGYGFSRHKGYGTPEHRRALFSKGPCPIHRLSYAPMRLMLEEANQEVGSQRGTRGVGRRGERAAAGYLEEQGYVICEMNYRCEVGEMDIVALDGGCLAFVEVRTRRSRKFGSPAESITAAKKRKLVEVAQTYLQEHEAKDVDWRIDVVSVQMSHQGKVPQIDLIKSAIEG